MNALQSLYQGLLFTHGHFATPAALRAADLLPAAPKVEAERSARPANAGAFCVPAASTGG